MEYKYFHHHCSEDSNKIKFDYFGCYETQKGFITAIMALKDKKDSYGWIYERTSSYSGIPVYQKWLDAHPGQLLIKRETIVNNAWKLEFIDSNGLNVPEEKELVELILGQRENGYLRHPSFGLIELSHVSSSENRVLFGSSLKHRQFITLSIHKAKLERHLSDDHIFQEGSPLIEIAISHTQFGELITSFNKGSGTPCTITYLKGSGTLAEPPFEDKRMQFDREFEETMKDVGSKTSPYFTEISKILENSTISQKNKSRILAELQQLKQEIDSNMPFVKEQFNEQVDKTILEAKGEIEAFMENKIRTLGLEGFKKELMELSATKNSLALDKNE